MRGRSLPFMPAAFAVLSAALPASAQVDYLPTINVNGTGVIPTENNYVPNVVKCEMGSGNNEALKAQAVVARTYAYYQMLTRGSLDDGTSDQVYTCGGAVNANHLTAASATACQILTYDNTVACDVISSFYVAGAMTTFVDGDLVPGSDPTNTEQYVTYNQGLTGADIHQTTLGFTTPNPLDFTDNRGCLSQNGALTLAANGFNYLYILRYYYGADIGITTVEGCGAPAAGPDCNANGVDDAFDLSCGASSDCHNDGMPDECQLEGNDCNYNKVPDDCEVAGNDCDENNELDDCQFMGQSIWEDRFESDTSAAWQARGLVAGNTVQFFYDYSANGIPPAPNSTGTTRGLKMRVNAPPGAASPKGVSVYPYSGATPLTFSGDYSLRWDMYLSWTTPASTEHSCIGINHAGTRVNGTSAISTNTDGIYFAADGDGDIAAGGSSIDGTIKDYNSYYGNLGAAPTRNSLPAWDHKQSFFQSLLPFSVGNPNGPSRAGSVGRQWMVGEIRQQDGVIYWLLNGTILSQKPNTSAFASGDIMLGYFDQFSSQSTNGLNFIVYDNVRVTVPPDCNQNSVMDACERGTLDLNGDGLVTPSDHQFFDNCTTGPLCESGQCHPPAYAEDCCALYDADYDGDVDLADHRIFQALAN